ncbi:HlyC/CorC family transporter [Candidatus Gottesmanbacteria bacterium]|nr:HlyC/CorC family transporter [Candidatus Gottesmanbacteria bacterium]
MDIIYQIILILSLILLNAFFVVSEVVLIASRRSKIDELVRLGRFGARSARQALDDLRSFITTTQIGTTVISIALGFTIEPIVVPWIAYLLQFVPSEWLFLTSHTIAITLAFILVTSIQIVLGELVPKTIAIQRSEKLFLLLIFPLILFTKIMAPISFILSFTVELFVKAFGFHLPKGRPVSYSEDEVKIILDELRHQGALPNHHIDVIQNFFKLKNMPIKDLTRPIKEMTAIPWDVSLSQLPQIFSEYSFSRFPVYYQTNDNIIGFIHIKDVYKSLYKNGTHSKLSQTKLVRKTINVSADQTADEVLDNLREANIQLAVVRDIKGENFGIVTMEDIFEYLVGDIKDEFDQSGEKTHKNNHNGNKK